MCESGRRDKGEKLARTDGGGHRGGPRGDIHDPIPHYVKSWLVQWWVVCLLQSCAWGPLACQSTLKDRWTWTIARRDPDGTPREEKPGACAVRGGPLASVEMLDCRFSPVPSVSFSLLDKLTNIELARSRSRERDKCTSSPNGLPTWPRANPTTEMSSSPRCPANSEPRGLGWRCRPRPVLEVGSRARWLGRLLLGAGYFRAACKEDSRGGRTASRGRKASCRGHCGLRAG
jgi:hypothetical protein